MNGRRKTIISVATAIGMGLLILDTKTAVAGAQSGVDLCIRTVIPSLLPFFFLSVLLTASLIGRKIGILKPVCRLCRIPEGAESIFLAGLLGGYPVGAQCVSQAVENGCLHKLDARRMLAFCSNCGPAFLFGIVAGLFDRWWDAWLLWGIHMASALCVGALLPGNPHACRIPKISPIGPVQALERACKIMAGVCGWVVLFKVFLSFLQRWFLWMLPVELQIAIQGLLELSNGCIALSDIRNPDLRFVLCAGILSFGGLCVGMQTWSVVSEGVDRRLYFPGKVAQCAISLLLAATLQGMINWAVPALAVSVLAVIFLRKLQNSSSIPQPIGV